MPPAVYVTLLDRVPCLGSTLSLQLGKTELCVVWLCVRWLWPWMAQVDNEIHAPGYPGRLAAILGRSTGFISRFF